MQTKTINMKAILITLIGLQYVIAQHDSIAGISETAAELYHVNFSTQIDLYLFLCRSESEKMCLLKIVEMCE